MGRLLTGLVGALVTCALLIVLARKLTNTPVSENKRQEEDQDIDLDLELLNLNSVPLADATLAFALLNTDFLDLDLSKIGLTSANGLAVMIHWLREIKDELPTKHDKRNLEKLLHKFYCAYQIEVYTNDAIPSCTDVTTFNAEMHKLEQNLIERLQNNETLYLASGWAGTPAGHNMIPYKDKDDNITVKARIQNRGAGLQFHESHIKENYQIAYDPEITLGEIPLN